MMEKLLNKMLDDILVVPMEQKFVSELFEICQKYTENIDIEKVENCVYSFVTLVPDIELQDNLYTQYEELYNTQLDLPPIAYIILAEFIVYLTIVGDNNITNEDKAKFSLVVKNMMILRKGSFNKVLSQSVVLQMYENINDYISLQHDIPVPQDSSLVPRIFEIEEFEDLDTEQPEFFDEVRYLAQQACLYRYTNLINKLKAISINDPYVKAFYIVQHLISSPKWIFVEKNVIHTLFLLLKEYRNSKQLSTIRENILNSEYYKKSEVDFHKSSIILRYFENEREILDISDKKFSVLEFAIYLYYELMLEYFD